MILQDIHYRVHVAVYFYIFFIFFVPDLKANKFDFHAKKFAVGVKSRLKCAECVFGLMSTVA